MKKVLYSGYYDSDGYPFQELAKKVEGLAHPNDLTEKDSILVIWGGSDISPSLYNHPVARRTGTGGKRDFVEWSLIQKAIEMDVPIIGVCRGGQMLCAAAGGFLIQDVTNHAGSDHTVKTVNGDEFKVTSLHHQMMFAPPEVDHELLAWCEKPRSLSYDKDEHNISYVKPYYIYKDDQEFKPPEGFKEPECYYFPKIKGLAIQWHPEMMFAEAKATNFLFKKMEEYKWL